jgi:hypothetical protein
MLPVDPSFQPRYTKAFTVAQKNTKDRLHRTNLEPATFKSEEDVQRYIQLLSNRILQLHTRCRMAQSALELCDHHRLLLLREYDERMCLFADTYGPQGRDASKHFFPPTVSEYIWVRRLAKQQGGRPSQPRKSKNDKHANYVSIEEDPSYLSLARTLRHADKFLSDCVAQAQAGDDVPASRQESGDGSELLAAIDSWGRELKSLVMNGTKGVTDENRSDSSTPWWEERNSDDEDPLLVRKINDRWNRLKKKMSPSQVSQTSFCFGFLLSLRVSPVSRDITDADGGYARFTQGHRWCATRRVFSCVCLRAVLHVVYMVDACMGFRPAG